jgi:tetratricopeptide (TPR) repeat protein
VREELPDPSSRGTGRKGLVLGAGGLAVAALGVAAVVFVGGRGPNPAEVLAPHGQEILRDDYASYGRAIDALAGAQAKGDSLVRLRATAAELAALAALGHGSDAAKLRRADQLLAEIPAESTKEPALLRARALVAIAKGKPREVDTLLGPDVAAPENGLVVALRRMGEGKPELALPALRELATARPGELLPKYVLARALEEQRRPEAAEAYRKVLAGNPRHAGAKLGLLRLSADPPEKRLEAARALARELGTGGSPGEQAELQIVLARAAAALGQTEEALAALQRAVAASPTGATTAIALGEAFLELGQFPEALARFRAAGAAALKSAAGKLGLGGALVGGGQLAEGLALVNQAAAESPGDPRGPYWQGFAAELTNPPDPVAAERSYASALAKDPRHLPSTLRLAALHLRAGRAAASMTVLRDAERAGAPAVALRLAWGEALVAGKAPKEAEGVFREAIRGNPKLPAAHAGLAAALEAQGDVAAAQAALTEALAALPDAVFLRERLADSLLRAGKKEEALAHLKVDVDAGRTSAVGRVKLAGLAIDVGKLDLAKAELDKVLRENLATPGALVAMARLREAQGNVAGAVQDYRRAATVEASPDLHLALGRALLKMGKDNDALAAFDAAGPSAAARLERGRIQLRKGDVERALADFQEAARLAPGDVEPLILEGACLDQMGQADRAAGLWARAIALAPQAFEAHYHLGRFKMDRGKPGDALKNLRLAAGKAPAQAPWEADLYFQLGYAELAAGSRTNGAAALQKYLALAPKDAPARPEVQRQLERLASR